MRLHENETCVSNQLGKHIEKNKQTTHCRARTQIQCETKSVVEQAGHCPDASDDWINTCCTQHLHITQHQYMSMCVVVRSTVSVALYL